MEKFKSFKLAIVSNNLLHDFTKYISLILLSLSKWLLFFWYINIDYDSLFFFFFSCYTRLKENFQANIRQHKTPFKWFEIYEMDLFSFKNLNNISLFFFYYLKYLKLVWRYSERSLFNGETFWMNYKLISFVLCNNSFTFYCVEMAFG